MQLDAAVHVIAHIGQMHNSKLVHDPSVFLKCDGSNFYQDAMEAIPLNASEPSGKEVDIRMSVDSDHAQDKVSHRSRSFSLIYVNTVLVVWFSKNHFTVDMSVFSHEFVTMKQGIDALRG